MEHPVEVMTDTFCPILYAPDQINVVRASVKMPAFAVPHILAATSGVLKGAQKVKETEPGEWRSAVNSIFSNNFDETKHIVALVGERDLPKCKSQQLTLTLHTLFNL